MPQTGQPFGPPATDTAKSYLRGSDEQAVTKSDSRIITLILRTVLLRTHLSQITTRLT
jgi:hypothetical protein